MRLAIAVFSILFLLGGHETGYGTSLDDFIRGSDGDDFIRGSDGDDFIRGHEGDDKIRGRDGDDNIHGGDGRDHIGGGGGNDVIRGGEGKDIIYGAGGDDWIDGGDGNDTARNVLVGGLGEDVFYKKARHEYYWDGHFIALKQQADIIRDFSIEDDLLVLDGYREQELYSNAYTWFDSYYGAPPIIKNPALIRINLSQSRAYYHRAIHEINKPKLTAENGKISLFGKEVFIIYEDGKRSQHLAEKIISEERFQLCERRRDLNHPHGVFTPYPDRKEGKDYCKFFPDNRT